MKNSGEPGLVVVTGAAGFIGANLVQALVAAGYRVVGCDSFGRGARWRYLEGVWLHDWLEPGALLDWLDRHADAVAAVVHLGAISATTEQDVDALMRTNVRLSLDLWERACRHDWRFVYASSAATYGDGACGFTDCDRLEALLQLRPLNAYGWSKQLVDLRIARDQADGRPVPSAWAGLRFFNVYGPREDHKGDMRSLVRKLVPRISAGERVELFQSHRPDFPDGGQRRDFIHVDDAVAVILRALAAPALSGLFNVGTGSARTFADLARACFTALGQEPRIDFVPMPEPLRRQYQYHTQADVAKAVTYGLQGTPRSLEQGVTDYVHWLVEEAFRTGHELV